MEVGLKGKSIPEIPHGYLRIFWSTIDELQLPVKVRAESRGVKKVL